jgi:hypothetical protein
MRPRFSRLQWLFPVALTLHNLEEYFWMPGFWQKQGLHIWVTAGEFRAFLIGLTLFGFLVTYWSVHGGKRTASAYLFVALVLTMLLNAFWHLGVTFWFRSYTPGIVTALFINLPINIYLLGRAIREQFIGLPQWICR